MAKNSPRTLRDQLNQLSSEISLRDMSLPCNWVERTFLIKIRDADLLILTGGSFPRPAYNETQPGSRGTHPIFLLTLISNLGFTFCPCSTKEYNADACSYIQKDTKLMYSDKIMNRKSYIVAGYSFNLNRDTDLAGPENYLGVVPEDAIQGDAYKRRSPR